MWHILHKRPLLLHLMIGNRFLKNRLLFFINSCHRRTNNRRCTHSQRRIYNGFYNHIALYYGCNNSRYQEEWFCDHRSGHIYPILLKSYLSHAPPDHLIHYKDSVFVSTILEYLSEQQKWSPYDLSRYLMKWQVTVLGSNFPIVGLNSLAPD
jgi:hypothetical protein